MRWSMDEKFPARLSLGSDFEGLGNLPIALVAAEDQKFPSHHGFDVDAIQDRTR